jgi:hypothetical protein
MQEGVPVDILSHDSRPAPRLTLNFSSCWLRFLKDRTRQKASVSDKRSRIVF